jgi:protein-tyrosine phosphatase
VVDLYGSSEQPERWFLYDGSGTVLTWPFLDGDNFPDGMLDALGRLAVDKIREGPVLLHCQAGLSRSASAAYALLRAYGGLSHAEALRRVKVMPEFPRSVTLASAREWVEKKAAKRRRRR